MGYAWDDVSNSFQSPAHSSFTGIEGGQTPELSHVKFKFSLPHLDQIGTSTFEGDIIGEPEVVQP